MGLISGLDSVEPGSFVNEDINMVVKKQGLPPSLYLVSLSPSAIVTAFRYEIQLVVEAA